MNDHPSALPRLPIRVRKENLNDDLRVLLKELRPEWDPECIQFKQSPNTISHGVMNTMVSAYITHPAENGIMCRVYGERFRDMITKGAEIDYIQLVRKYYDFAPNILLTFENGYCYDYIDGEVLTCEKLRLEPIWRTIAKQIAQMHSISVPEELRISCKLYEWYFTKLEYPEKMSDEKLNERLQNELPSKQEYERDHTAITKMVKELDVATLFIHGDLRPENMVWNENTGKITFVDFECAAYDAQFMDIAYHFYRYTGIKEMDYNLFPSEEFQREWLRVYLEELRDRTGRNKDEITDHDIEVLRVKALKMYLLMLIVTAVSGPTSYANGFSKDMKTINIDFFEMGARSYIEYNRVKDTIMNMPIPE